MKNHIKIGDFSNLLTDFEKLTDTIDKSSQFLFGNKKEEILPVYLVRTLAHIENSINEVTND